MNMRVTTADPAPAALSRPSHAGLAVLVVDDEADCREEIAAALERRGMTVLSAGSAGLALRVLAQRPDIGALVTDIRMPGTDGLALAERVLTGRPASAAVEVVLVTGYVSPAYSLAAQRIGACKVLPKPLRGNALGGIVEDALARAAARRRAAQAAEPGAARAAGALLATPAHRPGRDAQGLGRIAHDLCCAVEAETAAGSAATRRLRGLAETLVEAAAISDGRDPAGTVPVSAHGASGLVAARLREAGIPCGRRIMLQPEADPAYLLDPTRLAHAVALVAEAAVQLLGPSLVAELGLDAGAGEARLDLAIRRSTGAQPADPHGVPGPSHPLSLTAAERLLAAQGGRLESWRQPGAALHARLFLRGA